MPTVTYRHPSGDRTIEYATEKETLDFANKVRGAGPADFLKVLLPSIPGDANSCILARAFNFDCAIDAEFGEWKIIIIGNEALAKDIWAAVGPPALDFYDKNESDSEEFFIPLPERIAHVAMVFDNLGTRMITGRRPWMYKYLEYG